MTTKLDYNKLGLMCGLEIHQQLSTSKLFCSCPSTLTEETPDFTITRKLRSVVGETGEIDAAALHEQKKEKHYIYEGFTGLTCLIETDEEPPKKMNQEALNVSLQIALLTKSKIIDTIQIMRKTVVDGSNTSGFQRTALVAVNGEITTEHGRVGIPTLSIEEDSARPIKQETDSTTYRLDRLGIPLIEIGTAPDITSPEQAKEVAEYLGMLLRSTGKVKRGLGTIRQDLNVSIKEGKRIEIKGAQDLKMIPTLVEYEVLRQKTLIEIKKDLLKRIKQMRDLENIKIDVTDHFLESESDIIKNTIRNKGIILALKLPKFKGFIAKEVQPGRRLGTEFSDRAKSVAGVGGIFHSDELPKYGITEDQVEGVKETLKCKDLDAFVLVATTGKQAEKALDAVFERALDTLNGIPGEVRRANEDGTTTFLRPMPGAARLYPETDCIPISPDTKNIILPELLKDKSARFKDKHNLGHDLATAITKSPKHDLFEKFVDRFTNIKAAFIAETLLTAEKQIKKHHNKEVELKDSDYEDLFIHLNAGKITKDSVIEILSKTNEKPIQDIIVEYELMDDQQLEKEVKMILDQNSSQAPNAIIGKVMAQLRGKADGKKIVEMVRKISN
jgi:glutamyl-tRNA(Gln) amidotransferase subunit E